MKATEILKKAEKIESHWIIISEPTKKLYGKAVRISGDPNIEIACIDTTKENDFKFKKGKTKYTVHEHVYINTKNAGKLISAICELLEMEI